MDRFYTVVGDPGHPVVSNRHDCLTAARLLAEKMAATNPGATYTVYEAVAQARTGTPPILWEEIRREAAAE